MSFFCFSLSINKLRSREQFFSFLLESDKQFIIHFPINKSEFSFFDSDAIELNVNKVIAKTIKYIFFTNILVDDRYYYTTVIVIFFGYNIYMTIKSAQSLIQKALSEVKTINTNEALNLFKENKCNLIDIRDIRELERDGKVENAVHIPRGMLEFWIDPNSQYFKEGKLDLKKEMVLFCAAGARSALAAKTLQDMGFEKVSHIEGGFGAIKQSEFKIK